MSPLLEQPDHRAYLRVFYESEKARGSGLTYAKFSEKAGIRSPNLLKLVMDGDRNLSPENTIRFARALGLKGPEAEVFEALVQRDQAKGAVEREYFASKVSRLRDQSKHSGNDRRSLEEYEFEMISSWIHHTLLVLTRTGKFRSDPNWLRKVFPADVSLAEIEQAFRALKELGMVKLNEKKRWESSHREFRTKPEMRREAGRLFYEGLFRRAIQAVRTEGPEERELMACLAGLSPKQMPELKRRVREFMESLNQWALSEGKPSRVYALSFAGFPLTREEVSQ